MAIGSEDADPESGEGPVSTALHGLTQGPPKRYLFRRQGPRKILVLHPSYQPMVSQ
ncbi:hypothetical protein F2Q70_00042362 [Brassica cretica]|nr:hypothetical protein F2Q70_00042362 [Brassica cretica]KAF2609203.1 hypothetical protein F2Q68_00043106 [Brassica cretica]